MKKIIIFAVFLLVAFSQNIFSQSTPSYKKYKRDFLDNVNMQFGLGYGYSDVQAFNDWGRTASYNKVDDGLINVNIRANYVATAGVILGLEWYTNTKSTTNVKPSQEAFGFRLGYHLRTFGVKNRWHLNFTTGMALNWTKIRFPNGNPPDAYLVYGFDRRKAFLRQVSTLITPEVELVHTFKEASEGTFFITMKAGLAVNAFRGAWKYGLHYEDSQGRQRFDSEIVYDVPNVFDQTFYFNVGIGFLFPTD